MLGLNVKGVGEVAKMTMTRDESLTPKGVSATRRGYNNLKGITQVEVEQLYYKQPAELTKWLETNSQFFINPVHPTLTPRGLLFDGSPGCVDGDTLVSYRRGKRNSGRLMTLQSLYRRFNGIPDGRNPPRIKDAPTYLQSMDGDGGLTYNRIVSIVESGQKECIRLTTSSGAAISLTPDHLICVASGEFISAGLIAPGMSLRMKGSCLPQGTGGRKPRQVLRREFCVKHHPYGSLKIIEGCVYKRLHYARIVVEARMNQINLAFYLKKLNAGQLEGLVFLPPHQEVHHLDENPRNDRLDNLKVMSKEEHARLHGKTENFNVEYVVNELIVQIEAVGGRMTYDVEMRAPHHNFVAGGFIVHNNCTGQMSGGVTLP